MKVKSALVCGLAAGCEGYAATNSSRLRRRVEQNDIYKLQPRQLSDSHLDSFSIDPILHRRIENEPKTVPIDLTDDPHDPAWSFEGYLQKPSKSEMENIITKRKRVAEYLGSLESEDRRMLKQRIKEKRIARAREAAHKRGVAFDEREERAMAVLQDGQVWSLRASPSDGMTSPYRQRFEFPGESEPSTEQRFQNDLGIGLKLRSQYNGYDMTHFPWSAQGCLSLHGNAKACYCTGTKISARLVLTAAHCLTDGIDVELSDNEIVHTSDYNINYWLPGGDGVFKIMKGLDDTPNGARALKATLLPDNWFYHQWQDQDWALIILGPEKRNCNIGWFGYEVIGEPALLNKTVNVFGYPSYFCEESPVPGGRCGKSIYGDSARPRGVTEDLISYPIDTQGGMSGSGVYVKEGHSYDVVGVHTLGSGRNGFAVKITEEIYHSIEDVRSKFPDSSACNA